VLQVHENVDWVAWLSGSADASTRSDTGSEGRNEVLWV